MEEIKKRLRVEALGRKLLAAPTPQIYAMVEVVHQSIQPWPSRGKWLKTLRAALYTPEGRAVRGWLCPDKPLTVSQIMEVAAYDSELADPETGRWAVFFPAGGSTLDMSDRAVSVSRAIIETLGWSVVVLTGRWLTPSEQRLAAEHCGREITATLTTRAFIVP